MPYRASHRFADMSPRKIRSFATLIRGQTLAKALQLLRFEPNKAARLLEAVLMSARGNAMDKGARRVEELIVHESRVDGAPTFKRFMPRARGTAYKILRRMAHIHITLVEASELQGNSKELQTKSVEQAPAGNSSSPVESPSV